MKIVIQRVSSAKVIVRGSTASSIGKGLLVFLGVGENDTEEGIKYLVDKTLNMRIFEDENDKLNYSLLDINGNLLIVSQFTLYADCKKGNRPNFLTAAKPDKAKILYEKFVYLCSSICNNVKTGIFAEHMNVELINDGPVTIILEN
jgi:D-tyrosyl-tRNA(Tyr) deacylase